MTTEAWVLHKRPSGDTSAWVSFFTRRSGLITCVYKGARTPKKQGMLQAFNPLWLALDIRKDCQYVRKVESTSASLELKGTSLFAGLYINELLYYVLSPLEPSPQLYEIYEYTLQGLTAVTERLAIEALLRRFEWMLLSECGYTLSLPSLQLGNGVDINQNYRYIAGKGFIPSSDGISYANIFAITQGQFNEVAVLKAAKLIMRQAIDHLLNGREVKSRQLFKQVK